VPGDAVLGALVSPAGVVDLEVPHVEAPRPSSPCGPGRGGGEHDLQPREEVVEVLHGRARGVPARPDPLPGVIDVPDGLQHVLGRDLGHTRVVLASPALSIAPARRVLHLRSAWERGLADLASSPPLRRLWVGAAAHLVPPARAHVERLRLGLLTLPTPVAAGVDVVVARADPVPTQALRDRRGEPAPDGVGRGGPLVAVLGPSALVL